MAERFTVEKVGDAAKRIQGSSAGALTVETHGHASVPEGTLLYWALKKGHVPSGKSVLFAGHAHQGPNVEVVLMYLIAPALAAGEPVAHGLNSPMTEEQYDAAVKAAYSTPVGENLAGVSDEDRARLAAKAAIEGRKASEAAARRDVRLKAEAAAAAKAKAPAVKGSDR